MADNLRWWKLWTTAPSDPDILSLPPALRWAWAALGAYTKAHGDSGMLLTTRINPVLAAEMGVEDGALEATLRQLPSVRIEESQNRPGYLAVTWRNWMKYQEDSTQAERRKASRLKRRGEERRRDKRRDPPTSPQRGTVPTGTGSAADVTHPFATTTRKPAESSGPTGGRKGSRSAADCPPGFAEFWQAYPKRRRLGQYEAIEAWKKLRLTEPQKAQLMRSLESWKASRDWQKDDGKWIPWPQKFLNKRRWEETVEVARPELFAVPVDPETERILQENADKWRREHPNG